MAKDARVAKQQQRAREDLAKALKRDDAELAVRALVSLPPADRKPLVARVAPLFAELVQSARRAQRWSAFPGYAARVENEPELLTCLDRASTRAEVEWALMWGAVHNQQWDNATRWWQTLEPVVETAAPVLSQALTAWVDSRGTPTVAEITPLHLGSPGSAPGDPHRGLEPIRPSRRTIPPPLTTAEVEQAVLMAASQGWDPLQECVLQWLGRERAMDGSLAMVAGPLCTWELLKRVASGSRHLAEPVELLARLVEVAPEDALASECRLVFRAVATRVHADPISNEDLVHALVASGKALMPSSPHLVRDAFLHMEFGIPVIPEVLPFMEQLFHQDESAEVLAKAMRMLRTAARQSITDVPTWLAQATRLILQRHPGRLTAALKAQDGSGLHAVLQVVVELLPPALAEQLLEEIWTHGDERLKDELGPALGHLLNRETMTRLAPPGGWRSQAQRELFHRIVDRLKNREEGTAENLLFQVVASGLPDQHLHQVMQLLMDHVLAGAGGPAELEMWERWRPRVGLKNRIFLALTLKSTAAREEREATARTYAQQHGSGFPAWMDVLNAVLDSDDDALAERLVPETVVAAGADPGALCKLYELLDDEDAPGGVIKQVAEPLVRSCLEHPPPRESWEYWVFMAAKRRFPSLARKKKEPAARKRKPPAETRPTSAGKPSRSASSRKREANAVTARRKKGGDRPEVKLP